MSVTIDRILFEKCKSRGLRTLLEDIEHRMIEMALKDANGVSYSAAPLLGINRTTLVEKRRRFGFPMGVKVVKK